MTHIIVNETTIRRGAVSLTIPPYDDRWEDYRFRCINGEYPLPPAPGIPPVCHAEKARLQRELALEAHITRVLESAAWDDSEYLPHDDKAA